MIPCLFNFCAEYITRNARVDEWQAEIKIARRNINNLRYVDGNTLMAESEKELKSLLMRVKDESEKAGLKFTIQKTKIMIPSVHGKQKGKKWNQWQISLSWIPESLPMVTATMKLKDTCPFKDNYENPRQHIKNQKYHCANKCPYIQSYGLFHYSCMDVRVWTTKKV